MMDSDDNDFAMEWYPYEEGQTINIIGGSNGYILRDEELGDPEDPEAADARVTLEQGRAENPGFFVSATLYGWMFHVARFAQDSAGNAAYAAIKEELTTLSALIPYEEDGQKKIQEKAARLTEAVAAFEARFAGEL